MTKSRSFERKDCENERVRRRPQGPRPFYKLITRIHLKVKKLDDVNFIRLNIWAIPQYLNLYLYEYSHFVSILVTIILLLTTFKHELLVQNSVTLKQPLYNKKKESQRRRRQSVQKTKSPISLRTYSLYSVQEYLRTKNWNLRNQLKFNQNMDQEHEDISASDLDREDVRLRYDKAWNQLNDAKDNLISWNRCWGSSATGERRIGFAFFESFPTLNGQEFKSGKYQLKNGKEYLVLGANLSFTLPRDMFKELIIDAMTSWELEESYDKNDSKWAITNRLAEERLREEYKIDEGIEIRVYWDCSAPVWPEFPQEPNVEQLFESYWRIKLSLALNWYNHFNQCGSLPVDKKTQIVLSKGILDFQQDYDAEAVYGDNYDDSSNLEESEDTEFQIEEGAQMAELCRNDHFKEESVTEEPHFDLDQVDDDIVAFVDDLNSTDPKMDEEKHARCCSELYILRSHFKLLCELFKSSSN
jgi:hypothetical protein